LLLRYVAKSSFQALSLCRTPCYSYYYRGYRPVYILPSLESAYLQAMRLCSSAYRAFYVTVDEGSVSRVPCVSVSTVPNRPPRSYFGPIGFSITHTFLYIDSDHPHNEEQCNLTYCPAWLYLSCLHSPLDSSYIRVYYLKDARYAATNPLTSFNTRNAAPLLATYLY
jgi:hypothetical protein